MRITKPNPIKTLAALLCLVCSLSASAYNFVKDGIYYDINTKGTSVTVTYKDTNYNSYSGTVNIPAKVTYNGSTYNVTSIGIHAFSNCTGLIRVVIPNSVQYIMNYAFENCTGLVNITLPESLSAVYNYVFSGCTNLKSIICLKPDPDFCSNTNNFPTSVYSSAKLIVPQGYMSAYQSNSLWSNFSTIEEMECDFAVDAIFYNDLGDNKAEVTYPNSFFTYNSNYYIGDVVIPPTVTHGGNTYTVTAIHRETFYYCHYLYSVSIPTTVSSIGNYAFYDCSNLTSCTIPEGVSSIEYCTFGNCPQLSSVFIPSSVTWIAQNAFVNCNNLTTVNCKATTPPICTDISCFPTAAYSNATLEVPATAVEAYQTASVWQNFSNIVGKSYDFVYNGIYFRITSANTAEVSYRDLSFNSYSGNITIPSTVTYNGNTYTVTAIGRSAFRQCPNLTGVSIPNTVTLIDYGAFYKCTSLSSVTIPNTVTAIEDYAFQETGLTSINIPNSVLSIGYACFYNCQSLISAYIPGSVQEMGTLCFQRSTALQSVTFGEGFTKIPTQCFTMCGSLSSVTVPSSLKTYGNFCFYETGVTSFDVNQGADTIAYGAFESCYQLTSFSIPASVRFIDESILSNCPLLAEITVDEANQYYCAVENVLYDKQQTRLMRYAPQKPEVITQAAYNCTSIDSYAFDGAMNLIYIYLGSNLRNLGSAPFNGCFSLANIMMPTNNPAFMADDGVLYSRADGGEPQSLLCYPPARPDKHYSVLNGTDTIKFFAFESAKALESVYLPQGLKKVEDRAFYQSSLKRVVIDEGLQEIQYAAFGDCPQLQSVYLPSTLDTIGQMAFAYDYLLSEITFAGGTPPTVDSEAFYGTGYDVGGGSHLYVPAGATSTYASHDWNSDYFTYNISEVSPLPANTEFTVDSLMYKTTDAALNTTVTDVTSTNIYDPGIPPKVAYQGNLCTVTSLTANSFQNCTRMVKAEVPFTVLSIGNYAFYNCRKVDRVVLNEGVQQIGRYAFAHMENLPSIRIPASVTSVGNAAFIVDPTLYGIYVEQGNPNYVSVDGALFSKDRKRLVAFPEARTNDYTVPDGTEVIGSEVFRGNASLSIITLPNSLQEIEGYAFFDCTALPTIEVPNGVTTIGNYAFYNCSSLNSADLPATLTSLGYNAFVGAVGLTTLTVRATTPPTCAVYLNPRTGEFYEPFSNGHYALTQLIVPRGSAQAYRQADVWKKFQNIIEADFPVEVMRGDVNNDGEVDINDVTLVIGYVLGNGVDIYTDAADVNYDGSIDINDVTIIISHVLGNPWPEVLPIDMWYLWGNFIGTDTWGDIYGYSYIGSSTLPLYPTGNFDMQGKGVLTWTGYIPRGYFSIVHTPGYYDDVVSEMWVVDNNTGQYSVQNMVNDDPNYSTILLDPGYYDITLDTRTMNLSIEPRDLDVPSYGSIVLVGTFDGWDNEADPMDGVNPRLGLSNHDWWLGEWTLTQDTGGYGDIKFCLYGSWDHDWGGNTFPYGTGEQYGPNIPAKKGTYYVFLNDITGQYNFIKK